MWSSQRIRTRIILQDFQQSLVGTRYRTLSSQVLNTTLNMLKRLKKLFQVSLPLLCSLHVAACVSGLEKKRMRTYSSSPSLIRMLKQMTVRSFSGSCTETHRSCLRSEAHKSE